MTAFAEYAAIDAVNWSTLKMMLRSPLAYRYAVDHPESGDTASRRVLRAIHSAVLTPDEYATAYHLHKGTRRGRAWDAVVDTHPGQEILTTVEAERAWTIAQAVRSHPVARHILSANNGWSERVVRWVDPGTGLACKGRIDRIERTAPEDPVVIWDLKTVSDASEEATRWLARRMGWACQLAHYRAGVRVATGRDCQAGLIVVEDRPPHDVGVYQVSPRDLDDAAILVEELLRRVAACRESGRWPGVGETVLPLSLAWDGTKQITIEEKEEEEPSCST